MCCYIKIRYQGKMYKNLHLINKRRMIHGNHSILYHLCMSIKDIVSYINLDIVGAVHYHHRLKTSRMYRSREMSTYCRDMHNQGSLNLVYTIQEGNQLDCNYHYHNYMA